MEPGRLSPSRGPPGGCGGSFAPPRSLRRLLLAALPPTVRAAAPHFSFTARPIPLYLYRPTLIPAAPTVIPALTPSFPPLLRHSRPYSVIPAKAGIHAPDYRPESALRNNPANPDSADSPEQAPSI